MDLVKKAAWRLADIAHHLIEQSDGSVAQNHGLAVKELKELKRLLIQMEMELDSRQSPESDHFLCDVATAISRLLNVEYINLLVDERQINTADNDI